MFRRSAVFLLILSIAFSSMHTVFAGHGSGDSLFSDISIDDPHYNYIFILHGKGVVNGNPDGTVGPNDPLLRADLVALVVRSENIPILSTDKNCFPDVQEQWFAGAVCAMVRLNYISGYPDGLFRPGREVTTGEAAKIKVNALTTQRFTNLQEAIDFIESRGAFIIQLDRDSVIPRKEAFARIYNLSTLIEEQFDSLGNPFDPETDTIMVVEDGGPVFYSLYNETQYERHLNQDPIILFFHAGWCSLCRNSLEIVLLNKDLLVGGAVIFQVNYDTELELRKEYGITLQDTFVAINRNGEVVATNNAIRSREEIQELIDQAVNE